MESKKNPNLNLENYRNLFFFVGMTLVLGVMVTAFEWKSEIGPLVDLEARKSDFEENPLIPPIEFTPPKPPKPKILDPVLEVVDHDEEIDEIHAIIDNDPFDDPFKDWEPVEKIPEEIVEIYDGIVEVMPEPVGGYPAFYQFLSREMKYPRKARTTSVEGKVYVQFVIDNTGSIIDMKVVKGIGMGCDDEALRILGEAPKLESRKTKRTGSSRSDDHSHCLQAGELK